MFGKERVVPFLILLLAASIAASAQTAVGPGFTYQGKIDQGGVPLNGPVNLRFSLFDAAGTGAPPVGGNQIGVTQTLTNVSVTNGVFTVTLNGASQFGSAAFNGQARFLQIEVCSDATCVTRATLSPRQPLTVAPYAAFATAPWVTSSGDISYTVGDVAIGTNSTTAGLHVKHEPTTQSGTLALEGTTHTYLTFYPDGFAAGRKGFFGYPDSTINDISLTNQISGGNISLAPGSGGSVNVSNSLVVNSNGDGALTFTGASVEQIFFRPSGHARVGKLGYYDHVTVSNDAGLGHGVSGYADLGDDGSWSNISDERMKTDIAPAEDLLQRAMALRPVEFFMVGQDCSKNPDKYLGLIAQEVQPILPSLVQAGSKDGLLTLNYDRIGVVAIGAIQEQQRMIDEQRKTIAGQQVQLHELTDAVAALKAEVGVLKASIEANSSIKGSHP